MPIKEMKLIEWTGNDNEIFEPPNKSHFEYLL